MTANGVVKISIRAKTCSALMLIRGATAHVTVAMDLMKLTAQVIKLEFWLFPLLTTRDIW